MTDAEAISLSTLVRSLAMVGLVFKYTMRSDVVHPGWADSNVPFGEELLRYERHLPLDPVARIDGRWRRALATSAFGASTVFVWCSAFGVVGLRRVIDAAMLPVVAVAAPTLARFVRYAIGARSGGRRSSGEDLLTFGILLAVWLSIAGGTAVPGRSWVLPLTAVVLVASAGAWVWARRRWST
jgi:hypothetical protein